MSDPVTVERDGHVLLIGVNRQTKRNAFDLAVIEALAAAYEALGTEGELRAAVLFGHGDHFSAGLDLAQVGPEVAHHGPRAADYQAGHGTIWRALSRVQDEGLIVTLPALRHLPVPPGPSPGLTPAPSRFAFGQMAVRDQQP